MSKFNVGNKVVRLSTGCSEFDSKIEARGIRVGQVYTIKKCNLHVQLEELGDKWWAIEYFKLYEEETMKQFTKSDLVAGKHVVEFRDEGLAVYSGVFQRLSSLSDWIYSEDYTEQLTPRNGAYIIDKVYEVTEPTCLVRTNNLKLIWSRPPKSADQIEYENLMAKIDELKAQAEKLKPSN